MMRFKVQHREPTLDILPKEWSETAKTIVSSPVPRGKARNSRAGWGRVGVKETEEWGREEIGEVKKD